MMNLKITVLCSTLAALCSVACGNADNSESIGSTMSALSAAQCSYFAVNGKTRICHATGSAKNPYVALDVSDNACVSAHAGHVGDFVAVGDPTCHGTGCLPAGAPSDPTINCCPGLTVQGGVCTMPSQCPPGMADCGHGFCEDGNCGADGT